MLDRTVQAAADLQWLATLLTGSHDVAADATIEAIASSGDRNAFFSTWMRAWSRRMVIARALAAVREDLAASARRMELGRSEDSAFPPSWALDRGTTKSDLEHALLRIDLFPRAALLLLVYERVPLNDATILLDSEPALVRKALAQGARDLTMNLARMQGWNSIPATSNPGDMEWRYV
jgi:DNA-directed RNA polymerase specialized sigma24 family protein